MTKAEIRTEVFRRLAEATPGQRVFWTEADVDTAIEATHRHNLMYLVLEARIVDPYRELKLKP